MKAIVCDKCGKVILIPEDSGIYDPETGVYCLINSKDKRNLDLCEECAEELMALVRKDL